MTIGWSQIRQAILTNSTSQPLPPKLPLPTLPSILAEFSRRAEDPDCSANDLGRLIETDAGLTGELLRFANSAACGLRNKAASARQAISLMGLRTAKSVLLTFGMQQALSKCKSALVNLPVFWSTNIERALLARSIARHMNFDPDLAYTASLMQDSLLPVLTNEKQQEYLAFLQLPDEKRPAIDQFERAKLGWDHSIATAQLLTGWGFPDDLTVCVLLHHQPDFVLKHPDLSRTAAHAVVVATWAPDALRQCVGGFDKLVQWSEGSAAYPLDEGVQQISRELAELTTIGTQHITLSRRCENRKRTLEAVPV